MKQVPFTHKGWFGLCPVYIAEDDSIEGPRLEPRLPFTEWLIHLSAWVYDLLNAESFPIMFTGELDPPKLIDVDHD